MPTGRLNFTLALVVVLLATAPRARGQVIRDGSLGHGPRQIAPVGRTITIPPSAGEQRGAGLFHSFQTFNIAKGQTVNFAAAGGTSDILARVTGGARSLINGKLTATGSVNLFLMNPAGVVFGPSGAVDVGGSFAVTTADEMLLNNGQLFRAAREPAPTAVLTTAAPVAFGFLHRPAAGIIFKQTPGTETPHITMQPGSTLSIVGAAIKISGWQLNGSGGRINLVSTDSAGTVRLSANAANSAVDLQGIPRLGPVRIDHGAQIASFEGGGVVIRGGQLKTIASEITTFSDQKRSGTVDVAVQSRVSLDAADLNASATDTADSGTVRIVASRLEIRGVPNPSQASPTLTSIAADTSGAGRGGQVKITADNLQISAGGSIGASALGSGAAGDVALTVRRLLSLDGSGADSLTGIVSQTSGSKSARGGNITIHAGQARIENSAEVQTGTGGPADAGSVRLWVDRTLLIDGHDLLRGNGLGAFTGIDARVGLTENDLAARGSGGQVSVSAGAIRLRRGGVITATTFGSGDGGTVHVHTRDLRIDGSSAPFTGLFARSTPMHNAGDAGDVRLTTNTLRIDGAGAPISPRGVPSQTGLVVEALGDGRAGVVQVFASGSVQVLRAGQLSAGSGANRAGGVGVLSSSTVDMQSQAVVKANSEAADSGIIHVTAARGLRLRDSTVTAQAASNGGSISLNGPVVAIANSTIDGLSGSGANLTKVQVNIPPTARLFTSNAQFKGGEITAPAPFDLSGQLTDLVSRLAAPSARVQELCGVRFGRDVSSFIVTGGNGVPPTPDALQPSGLSPTARPEH